jgi:hypothetical protein
MNNKASFAAVNKVYGCVVQRKDHLINKETGKYDKEEYLNHPDRYTSTFKTQVSVMSILFSLCVRLCLDRSVCLVYHQWNLLGTVSTETTRRGQRQSIADSTRRMDAERSEVGLSLVAPSSPRHL